MPAGHPLSATNDSYGGRLFDETEHEFRTPYQRDRDRIIHSKAFRRLESKTQVFVNHEGDHYRTRLTHTIEVAQIARTVSRALGLNEDLAESVALGHDLGHPPFGHAGEAQLNELMKDAGGFEHNRQTIRIVENLEKRYPMFDGLNLSRLTLRGLMKHGGIYKGSELQVLLDEYPKGPLETKVADMADSIAYNCHDLDDGLAGGYLTVAEVASVPIWFHFFEEAKTRHPDCREEVLVRYTIRSILAYLVEDLVGTCREKLSAVDLPFSEYTKLAEPPQVIGLSEDGSRALSELRKYLRKHLYAHTKVSRMAGEGQVIVEGIFNHFLENPHNLPANRRLDATGSKAYKRVVCDYVAGMTDRYAVDIYSRYIDSGKKWVFEQL